MEALVFVRIVPVMEYYLLIHCVCVSVTVFVLVHVYVRLCTQYVLHSENEVKR